MRPIIVQVKQRPDIWQPRWLFGGDRFAASEDPEQPGGVIVDYGKPERLFEDIETVRLVGESSIALWVAQTAKSNFQRRVYGLPLKPEDSTSLTLLDCRITSRLLIPEVQVYREADDPAAPVRAISFHTLNFVAAHPQLEFLEPVRVDG